MMNTYKTLFLHSLIIHKIYKLDTKLLNYSYKNYSTKRRKRIYSKELGIIYANFTIALVHNKLNLDRTKFKNYSSIIKYLEEYKGDKLFTSHYISQLKNNEFNKVPLTEQSLDFINYVKKTFPDFNHTLFVTSSYPPGTKLQQANKSAPSQSDYIPSISEAKPIKVTTKDIEIPTKITNINTTYSGSVGTAAQDQKTKSTNLSFNLLRSIHKKFNYLYKKFNYLYLILPCFILLILAVKDNPELLNEYIKEWITELNTIISAQTYNIDVLHTSNRIPADEAQDVLTHSFREQHLFDNLDNGDPITYKDCASYATTDYQNSYPDITNFYDRIEGVSEVSSRSTSYTEPKSNNTDIPVSSSLSYLEDIPSRWPTSNTTYTQTNTIPNPDITVTKRSGYSDTVIYAATPDTYPTIKDIAKVNSKSVYAKASDWWLPMLDFNNLKYFPSLFEDLSKPRETYTIVQYTKDIPSELVNYNTYPTGTMLQQATNLENNISSITAPATKSSIYSDIISYNTKLTKASSKLASAAVENVTTVNITPMQNSNISPPYENNITSISYKLNRDSVSSTYSKYFYSELTNPLDKHTEDTNATDKVNALLSNTQDLDKHTDDTQVKLFVSEYTDNTENNKKLYESKIPEPVTPEQVCIKDTSNSELAAYPLGTKLQQAKPSIEPFSPYSPSIISDYSDIQVPIIKDTPINPPLFEDDMSVDLKRASYNTKASISTNTESSAHDLSLPDLNPNKLTSLTLTEDYSIANTESNHDSWDFSIPEAKPTIARPPLDDFDETSSLLNHQDIDMYDLSNAKSTIVNNNKHIMNIELNLDTLQDRLNSINDESSSLLQEKAELTNKLNNNSHNVEPFTERTANYDNPLYTTYKNAYNSFMQWNINTSSPVSNNDIISKLNKINNKLNSLEETKSDLLNSINNNNNSLVNFNKHNTRLRQFILENSS